MAGISALGSPLGSGKPLIFLLCCSAATAAAMYRGSSLGSVETGRPSLISWAADPAALGSMFLGLGLKSLRFLLGEIALASLESGLRCISVDLAMAKSFMMTCLEVKC